MNTDLRKKSKMTLKNTFFKLMQLLEKPWKMSENIEISSLSQQKEEETMRCQN